MLGFLVRTKNTITQSSAQHKSIFPATDPSIDGEDCLRDCASCSVKYPSRWKINEDIPMYGLVKGWSRHILVATGKSDWKREPSAEEGSLCEALETVRGKVEGGRLMISASNIPMSEEDQFSTAGSILLLPAFVHIDNVTPSSMPSLIKDFINRSPSTTTSLKDAASFESLLKTSPTSTGLTARTCPHRAIILLCSHKSRDARCGQSAPLIKKELNRHLRALGLDRDEDDMRPGGVGIYFVSHTGGHKFAANVIIYRRRMADDEDDSKPGKVLGEASEGAFQGIWLARVRPEDCENIVRYTVLKGKIVKPERQLRGGFDREKGLVSW